MAFLLDVDAIRVLIPCEDAVSLLLNRPRHFIYSKDLAVAQSP